MLMIRAPSLEVKYLLSLFDSDLNDYDYSWDPDFDRVQNAMLMIPEGRHVLASRHCIAP